LPEWPSNRLQRAKIPPIDARPGTLVDGQRERPTSKHCSVWKNTTPARGWHRLARKRAGVVFNAAEVSLSALCVKLRFMEETKVRRQIM
jgi:hypothetical protein